MRKPFKLKHNKIEFARRNHHNLKNGHKFAVFGWGVNKVSLDCIISACRYDEYREKLAPFCFFKENALQNHAKRDLQVVSGIKFFPWNKCRRQLKQLENVVNMPLETMLSTKAFCTKQPQGSDACQGDSGGPLYLQKNKRNKKMVWYLPHSHFSGIFGPKL